MSPTSRIQFRDEEGSVSFRKKPIRICFELIACVWVIAFASPVQIQAYTFFAYPQMAWPEGTIPMDLLDPSLGSSGVLIDGSTSWRSVAENALAEWNLYINTVEFTVYTQSKGPHAFGDRINQAFFDWTIYGQSFDQDTVALTLRWSVGSSCVEADTVFNKAKSWNSYRGNQKYTGSGEALYDFYRIALHEFGHILGLHHPDQAVPVQYVNALMNSTSGDLDGLTTDDITGSAELYYRAPPAITSQPQSRTVAVGGTVTFVVVASGIPSPDYQWFWNDILLPGADSASLTFYDVRTDDAGAVDVVVSNSRGWVVSQTAVLTVTVPPSITAHPQSRTVTAGSAMTFSVAATGTAPLSYQWYFNGSPISGATASSYSLSAAQPDTAGNFKVRVRNAVGAVDSATAVLTVNVPVSITKQPVSKVVSAGNTATFSVVASGTAPLSYQWYFIGSPIAGATASTYSRTSAQPSNTGDYKVRVSNPAGSVDSAAATLTVQYTPVITLQPQSKAVAAGYAATFSVTANAVPSPSYQWRRNGVNISGATSATYTMSNVQTGNAGNYSAVVANSVGSATSATAVLTVGFPYTFTTLAGSAGQFGSADGTGSAALFQGASGVAVDSVGNVYVADSGNHTIRKVTPAGTVTTLAGLAGVSGTDNGTGSAARFNGPFGVAVDSAGTVYVADTRNYTIRKVTPAGAVTTLAGLALIHGSADGTGSAAQFNSPYGVAVDSAGNVYVADTGNATIRRVTSAGGVTTLAGLARSPGSANGTGSTARFNGPTGVAVDSTGNVYVAEGNHTIRKVTPAGTVTTLAGLAGNPGSADGTGSAARFNYPYGVAVDSADNVYVSDRNNNTIRKVTSAGVVTTLAGLALIPGSADGTGNAVRFNSPFDVAVDTAGNVYVAEIFNNTIRKGWPFLNLPPVITVQPQTTTATVGSTITFFVAATGSTPSTFQWRRNGVNISGATSATYTMSNVQTGNAGNYTVVVSNAGGAVTSSTAVLTINVAPSITAQPQSKVVTAGNNLTFSVVAKGTAPLSYQWYRNNSPIPGATAASYAISGVQMDGAGAYKVRISNSAGAVDSAVATLTVKADAIKPVAVISSPAAGARLTNSVVTLTGTARDNIQVTTVECRLENSQGIGTYQPATGTSNWSATIAGLIPGPHTVRVRARDAAGNWSAEVTRSFTYVLLSPLTLTTSGLGSVMPNLNGQRLEVGKTYTLTAMPAPGHVLSNWTGGLVANSAKLSFAMQSNLTLQANFVTNPFIALRGSYNGLFYETDETNGVRLESSGFFNFALVERGSCSGYLRMNTGRYPFSGQFGLDGQTTNMVRRPGLTNNLRLELTLDLSRTTTDRLTGRVVSTNGGWTAEVLADRAPVYALTNGSPFQGKYTALIPGEPGSSESPGGCGIGTLTVAKNGRLSWSGTLGDGKLVTQSVPISEGGYWPLFATPYGAKGSVLGWVSLDTNRLQDFKTNLVSLMPTGNLAEASLALGGSLSWIKLSQPGKYYPNGFTNEALVFGSAYAPKTPVLESGDWQMHFAGGNLSTDYVNNLFLTPNNKLTNAPMSQPPLVFQVNLASGMFSGNAKLPDSSLKGPLSFKGVVLQGLNLGFGQFFGTNQSGQVSLQPRSFSQ